MARPVPSDRRIGAWRQVAVATAARWHLVSLLLALLAGVVVGHSDIGRGFDRLVQECVWSFRHKPVSGTLQIVEIDARSIAAIDRWPWPRRHYAKVVDELRQAGAATISFDVDFSSHSSISDDLALARSLQGAGGGVTLPTFVQAAGSGTNQRSEALPIPVLREHVALAAVSVLPDGDGVVRRMPLGIVTGGTPRPSLSAMAAGAGGAADVDFPIDFSIDPDIIPRSSFMDVEAGRFARDSFRGKHVVIGATAVELGDRYAVPRYGVLPGVVIQALAAETLFGGVPREMGWRLPLALAFAAGTLLIRAQSLRQLGSACLAGLVAMLGLALLGAELANQTFVLAPALLAWSALALLLAGGKLLGRVRRDRRHDAATGLPNRVALEEALQRRPAAGLMVATIADFEKLSAGLGGHAIGALVQRVHDRIATVVQEATVYRLDDRTVAWRLGERDALEQQAVTLRTFMMSPVEILGKRVDVTLRMGFAAEPEGESGLIAQVIDNALLAASRALNEGSNLREFHESDVDTAELELSLLGELDDAIASNALLLYYQPKLDLSSNRIDGVEALVRWEHPRRGFLRPDSFIPLAEQNNRISRLTLHVLSLALADLRHWHANGLMVTCAVNVSAKLLTDSDFLA